MANMIVDELSGEEIAKYYGSKYHKSALVEGGYEAEDFFTHLGDGGKWLFFTAAPLKDQRGKVIAAIETFQDITERKQAEEELERIDSRVGTRGKLFEPTDCEKVLERALTNLQMAIEDSGAVGTHDALPTVMADGSQLVLLFQNLIDNAIKFRSKEPPRIHVSATRELEEITNYEYWLFSVRDNGIGIEPEFFERLFVIFQRLHSRGEYSGTGIGLAVCKKIVERHDGRIWVESESGKGATFYFTIPVRGGGQE